MKRCGAPGDLKRHMHSGQKHRDATRLPPDISGVFEIWEKWVGLLCKGTINSAISKHPPGG